MTDISVIKMIISVAVWRIYPSWVNDKLRAWEGLDHSRMFWARLSRDDFRSKLEIISFLSRVMSVSKSFFVSRAFERFGAKRSSSWAFGSDDVLETFLKTPLRHQAFFLGTPITTTSFWKFSFFSKTEPVLLDWQQWRSQAEQSTLVMALRKLEWKLDFLALVRSCADGPSIVAAIGTSRVRWSMVRKNNNNNKKKKTRMSEFDCAKSQPFITYKPASFEEPVSETRCCYRFAPRCCYRVRGCTAAGRSGCSAGKAKKSSQPWCFRCWSPRRNELGCTDLVHWTGALHRLSSRDGIFVVGSVLEKHFYGDFTPDQEKEITFKRWPPGYQSWKPGLARNGLKAMEFGSFFTYVYLLTLCWRAIQKSVTGSLDNPCVIISQRNSTNKISLERYFHYLNEDTLFLKIWQEMTPLQLFEVTQLIDFALDRSTRVTPGRNFAHCIALGTQNVLECIQQIDGKLGSKLSTSERTNFIAAPQTKNDWIFRFSHRNATSFTQDHVSLAFEEG